MSEEKNTALAEAEARLKSVFDETAQKMRAGIDAQLKEIEEKGKASEALGADLTETKAQLETQRLELEKMRAQLGQSIADKAADRGFEWKSAGERIEEAYEGFKERWSAHQAMRVKAPFSYKMELDGLFPLSDERKTTIDSAAVGSSTPGILTPQRVAYVPAAERRLTIRDLLPSSPTGANTIEFPKENAFTNAASPQTEASAKAESALTFTIASEPVRTLAHWIPATNQVLDDWTQLRRIIDQKMLYGLMLKEETEILTGSGTGVHLNGLVTQATAYAGTYDVATDTQLDTLGWAFNELEAADEEGDFIVIHPDNFWNIMHIKEEGGGANLGSYVIGDPLGGGFLRGVTLWGKRLIVTNSMTTATFLVGNTRMAEVFDRQQSSVAISTEHASYFIQNMVAIRVEERLALCVYRPGAFRYGTFPT